MITVTELIRQSWHLYRSHWRIMATYILLFFLLPITLILVSGLALGAVSRYFNTSNLVNLLLVFIPVGASLIISLWISMALIETIARIATNRPVPKWTTALTALRPLIWPVIMTSFIVVLIILGGTIFFIIPGIIFSVWYAFTTPAIVIDKEKGLRALNASKSLVVGRWWAVAWRLVAPAAFFSLASLIFQFATTFIASRFISSAGVLASVNSIVSATLGLLLTPFGTILSVLLYLNAKETATLPQAPPSAPTAIPEM